MQNDLLDIWTAPCAHFYVRSTSIYEVYSSIYGKAYKDIGAGGGVILANLHIVNSYCIVGGWYGWGNFALSGRWGYALGTLAVPLLGSTPSTTSLKLLLLKYNKAGNIHFSLLLCYIHTTTGVSFLLATSSPQAAEIRLVCLTQ